MRMDYFTPEAPFVGLHKAGISSVSSVLIPVSLSEDLLVDFGALEDHECFRLQMLSILGDDVGLVPGGAF